MSFETISVIGLGYIGLPTAAMFAAYGKNVIGVDVNPHAVDTINRGEIHIVEPDLDAIVHKAVNDGKLKAVLQPEPADAFLIAVPTPFKGDNHEPDLTYIEKAALAVAQVLKKGDLVILESTSPVGATEQMADWLAQTRPDLTFPKTHNEASDIRIAHCPERVLPGHVVRELVENDRVIGGITTKCSERSVELYKIFVQGNCFVTNARTAEMTKLTENSFRDVNIAFANELSMICDEQGINVWDLIKLANYHPRVNILQPGSGVGGHCIAVDPWFIVSSNPESAKLIKQARLVNDEKPRWVVQKVIEATESIKDSPVVACMGLAFKPNIDDLRESPALRIVEQLCNNSKAKLLVVEPNVDELPKTLASLSLVDVSSAIREADVVLFLVAHTQFLAIDKGELEGKVIIDACGVVEKD